LNYQDFMDWKASPVTKAVFLEVLRRKEELKERLVGEMLASSPTAQATAGAIQALEFLLNMDYEDSNGN
jgi:hypothetical protein